MGEFERGQNYFALLKWAQKRSLITSEENQGKERKWGDLDNAHVVSKEEVRAQSNALASLTGRPITMLIS